MQRLLPPPLPLGQANGMQGPHLDGGVDLEQSGLDGVLIGDVQGREGDHGKLVQQVYNHVVQRREPAPRGARQRVPELQRVGKQVHFQRILRRDPQHSSSQSEEWVGGGFGLPARSAAVTLLPSCCGPETSAGQERHRHIIAPLHTQK